MFILGARVGVNHPHTTEIEYRKEQSLKEKSGAVIKKGKMDLG